MREVLSLDLVPDDLAPRHARHAVEHALGDADPDLRERLSLLLTEVVTNAVVHARLDTTQRIQVLVTSDDEAYRAEVHDPGVGFHPGRPTLPEPESARGRGLYLVAAVADRWGAESVGSPGNGQGSCVWFEVASEG